MSAFCISFRKFYLKSDLNQIISISGNFYRILLTILNKFIKKTGKHFLFRKEEESRHLGTGIYFSFRISFIFLKKESSYKKRVVTKIMNEP